MKKMMAMFMAVAFALSCGLAFAQEAKAPAAPEQKAEEKAPAKKKKAAKKEKKHHKKAAKKAEAAPAPAPEAK